MNIPRSVILDLLPLYLAGEVSQETREFVDQYLQTDPELATLFRQPAIDLPEDIPIALSQEDEMKALYQAKRYAFWRTVIIAVLTSFMVLALTGGIFMILILRSLN